MATKAKVIKLLRSFSDVEDQGDDVFQVTVPFKDNDRSQLLFMDVRDDLLIMLSPFAKRDDISPAKAIDMAKIYGVGTNGDYYVLCNVLHMENLTEGEIITAMTYLAIQADILEEEVGGDDL